MLFGIIHNIYDETVAKFVKLCYNIKEYDWFIIPVKKH